MSPGSKTTQIFSQDHEVELTKTNDQKNPLIKNPIKTIKMKLSPKGKSIGIPIARCEYVIWVIS